MLPQIKVNIDKEFLSFLTPARQNSMLAQLTNRMATLCGKDFKSMAKTRFGIRKNPPFKVRRAKPSNLIAYLWTTIRHFGLMSVGRAQEAGQGVTADFGGQQIILPGAFIESGKGRDWSRYGQKQQMTTPRIVLKRYGSKPYPLVGGKTLMREQAQQHPDYILSLGKYLISDEVQNKQKETINSQGAGIMQELIDNNLHKRAMKTLNED